MRNVLSHLAAAALAVACVSASTGADTEPLRIVCIGDSITQGGRADRPEYTYRLPLQQMLTAAGVSFDFIGTRRDGVQAGATWPVGFDPDHEGFYGQRTAFVRDRLAVDLPQLPAPDVALVLLGWNDQFSLTSIVEPMHAIVGLLRARNPRITVLLGQPALHSWRGQVIRFMVGQVALRLDSSASRVVAVDHAEGWVENPASPAADTFDWAHPNPRGQEKMAARWFAALRPFLPASAQVTPR